MESPDDILRREFEQARSCFVRSKTNSFCILCRRRKPRDIVLSHVVPLSVLKSAHKDTRFIGVAGQEVGSSKMGYRGYCKSCEGMLSRGEQHFDQLMHAPLVDNFDSAIHVESKDAAGVYHCAISVWWRYSTLGGLAYENSPKAKVFRKLLERVRVWLHKPSNTLPLGLQVSFRALSSHDLSCLQNLQLDLVATGSYIGPTDSETKRIDLIYMGPLNIKFCYLKLSCFQIFTPIDICTSDARPRYTMQGLVECMTFLRDVTLNLEMRASKDVELPSSAPVFRVRNTDIIPQRIATIDTFSKKVIFHYHRLIKVEMCKTSYCNVQLELYKPKKVKSDDPPYDALATHSNERGRVRIWLRSDPTGKRFEFHKDISSQLPFKADFALECLRRIVSQLKLP